MRTHALPQSACQLAAICLMLAYIKNPYVMLDVISTGNMPHHVWSSTSHTSHHVSSTEPVQLMCEAVHAEVQVLGVMWVLMMLMPLLVQVSSSMV